MVMSLSRVALLAPIVLATVAVTAFAGAGPAAAEASRVRLVKQNGLPFLPMIVAERQLLVDKHAKAAGVEATATWNTIGNAASTMDMLISGSIDIIGAGLPALAVLWDRTAGTPQEIKALGALNALPNVLVTRNPKIRTIEDYGDNDRIALPGVKITAHAIILQMAVAQKWGIKNYDRLDRLTVSMTHPDAAAAMLSGGTQIESHFTSPPFIEAELADPKIRKVLHSYEVTGGMLTNGLMITSTKFFTANPKLSAAVMSALREANAFIEKSPREAAQIYIEMVGEKRLGVDEITAIVTHPDVKYSEVPLNMMKVINFMHETGVIRKKPESWRDMFFASAHDLPGS